MPPKTQINEKQVKPANEADHKFITLDEMKAKEFKYFKQLAALKQCLHFIDEALLEVGSLNEQTLLADKWQEYLSCSPFPRPFVPPDIRLFYNHLKYKEKENLEKTIDWSLSVNERSILTQDMNHQDLTRRKLGITLKKDIGEEYGNYVRESLHILQRIENFLANDVEVARCKINVFNDILSRKWAIQQEITDLLDRFTYRIISSENDQMQAIDSITAEYFFNTNDFEMHIWCLKNVAIRISHLREPHLLANFHTIKLSVQIPSSILKENLVVRALHLNFDNLSPNAKSFEKTIPMAEENLNAGIVDLYKCLLNEWLMQVEIIAKVRQEMVKKRLQYEEQLRQYEKQQEANKKTAKKNEKSTKNIIKVVKPKNEPIAIENDMFPDTYAQFLQAEQQQYEHFSKSVYEPGLFNLSADEINLRNHLILGGIYQIFYIEKPMHIDFNSFHMTCHYNDAKLSINKNVRISKEMSEPRLQRRSTIRMTISEAENEYPKTNIECPWFVVTFELPPYLCLWGEPVACHFEETKKYVKKSESIKKEPSEQTSGNVDVRSRPLLNFNSERTSHLTAFDELNSPLQPDLYHSLYLKDNEDLKTVRAVSNEKLFRNSFYRDSLASSILFKRKSQSLPDVGMHYPVVNDFPLADILTNPQIRHMQRHIVPRIISSYKFPNEIKVEQLELFNRKPTTLGGRTFNQNNNDRTPEVSSRQFTFSDLQDKPERMFVKYPKTELLTFNSYVKKLDLNEDPKEPQTFAQLLQVVAEIKRKYRLRQHKVIDVKPLEQEITTHNDHIKQMLDNKQRTSARPANRTSAPSTGISIQKSIKFDTQNGLRTRQSRKTNSSAEDNLWSNEADAEDEHEVETYSHWTTKYIFKSEFDRENHKIILHTDRLGDFGFAFKRYEHFPFKHWSMEPNKDDPENEIVFTLDTQHVRCVLYISAQGIRGHVMEPYETKGGKPKIHLVIEKPIKDFKEFKQLFNRHHLNIFAEHDARYYIENGYFSEKHLSTEFHTYNCMAVHSTQILFKHSEWNRLAKRRDVILHFQQYQDVATNLAQVRITPGEAYFVEIRELCSEDLDVVNLNYKLTWRNIESYSDLHQMIVSMYPTAIDLRCKNLQLLCSIRHLLSAIRPLSFS